MKTTASPTSFSANDLWSLIDLHADYYWQESSTFVCVEMHCNKRLEGIHNPLQELVGSTLWDMGCLVTGRAQNWRQHLTERNQQKDFKELICKLPARLNNDENTRYVSISGKARFDENDRFVGYHCFARDISEQVETEMSLRRFRSAMDMSGDMIYLIDRKSMRFIDVNDTAWKKGDMSKEQLLALGPQDGFMRETVEELEKRYDHLIIDGGTSRTEHKILDKDGKPAYLETYSRATCIDGNWIIIGVTRNVTRRKNTERTAQKLHRMYSSLSETNAASLRAVSVESLYHSVCDAAVKGGRFALATIFAPNKDQALSVVAFAGDSSSNLSNIVVPLDPSQAASKGLMGTAFFSKKACVSNDFLNDPRTSHWHSMGADDNVYSAAAFPLLCKNESVAILLFYSYEKNVFDDELVKLLQSMADNVSFALENFSNEQQRKSAEAVLQESEERFRSLTHLSTDFFWEMDSQFCLKTYEGRVVGESNIRAVSSIIGHAFWEFPEVVCNSITWGEFKAKLNNHELFHDVEISFTNSEGNVYHLAISGEPIYDNDENFSGYLGITRDITERRRNSMHIQYLANHDTLTDLPNRAKFNELLTNSTRLAKRYPDRAFALFFIDIDRFKNVNDTYGHHTGDDLLKDIAKRLKAPLRETDVVARLGGDEFVIIVNQVQERDTISIIADNVLKEFSEAININGNVCDISVSIGISIYGVDADDEDTLLQHADSAMYVGKPLGKNNYQFFSSPDDTSAHAS